jgi:hypothetical protein
MTTLPSNILQIFQPFSKVFSNKRSWMLASFLFVPLILTKGGRTICRLLRFAGLKGEKAFDKYHKLLNRANWNMLRGSKILLQAILRGSSTQDTVYIAIDEHLERRRGPKIKAIGCYRDAVLSTKRRKVKSFGLKWMSVAVLKGFSWSKNIFALPFLTVLTRSKESDLRNGERHKTTTDWMCQIVKQIKRWLGNRRVVFITDGGLNSVEMALTTLKNGMHWITRLPCNARLYDFPPVQKGLGRRRVRGAQLEKPSVMLTREDLPWKKEFIRWYGGVLKQIEYVTFTCIRYVDGFPPVPVRIVLLRDPMLQFESVALMGVSSDMSLHAVEIMEQFVSRWNLEVTFREAREHLGIETQRQWSDNAIERTTPILFSLYSLVLLMVDSLNLEEPIQPITAAWYQKSNVTFSDALAMIRKKLWQKGNFNFLPVKCRESKNLSEGSLDALWEYLAECA